MEAPVPDSDLLTSHTTRHFHYDSEGHCGAPQKPSIKDVVTTALLADNVFNNLRRT